MWEDQAQALIDEFIDVLSRSFCGTSEEAPEAAISWVFDPASSGANPADALTGEPSAARTKYFQFQAGFMAHWGFRHGGCFALRGEGGASAPLVAAVVTIPPNTKGLHATGLCEMMDIVKRMGGWDKVKSPEVEGGPSAKRHSKLEALQKKMHKEHAPGLHLYVLAFGTAPGHQRKGYGRKLAQFLVDAAGRMEVPAYLECCGKQCESFYESLGFKVVKRHPLEVKRGGEVDTLVADGQEGFTAMVWTSGNQLVKASTA